MARRRGGGRAVARRGKYIWSVVVIDDSTIANGAPQGHPIVGSSDYTGAGAQAEVTLMGIRGWLSWSGVVGSTADQAFAAVAKIDEDEDVTGSTLDPASAVFYGDSDILWTGGFTNPALQTSVGVRAGPIVEQLNIKSRRKLKSGQGITLQVVSQAGSTIRLSGVLRAIMLVN